MKILIVTIDGERIETEASSFEFRQNNVVQWFRTDSKDIQQINNVVTIKVKEMI